MSQLDRTATAWRLARASVAEAIFWIGQHRAALDAGKERPEYLAYAELQLGRWIEDYLRNVRIVSEAEEAMTAAGVSFEREPR